MIRISILVSLCLLGTHCQMQAPFAVPVAVPMAPMASAQVIPVAGAQMVPMADGASIVSQMNPVQRYAQAGMMVARGVQTVAGSFADGLTRVQVGGPMVPGGVGAAGAVATMG